MLYIVAYLLVCILCGVVFAATAEVEPCDLDLLIEALRQVENWDGKSRGAAGERGPWQITPGVWVQFSDQPFAVAEGFSPNEQAEQRRVAHAYVSSIAQRLLHAHRDRDALTVAIVWAAGWNSYFWWQPHKPTKTKFAYAKRAENLYHDLAQKAAGAKPPVHQIPPQNPGDIFRRSLESDSQKRP